MGAGRSKSSDKKEEDHDDAGDGDCTGDDRVGS